MEGTVPTDGDPGRPAAMVIAALYLAGCDDVSWRLVADSDQPSAPRLLPRTVHRAIQAMQTDPGRYASVSDLAQVTGVSPRSLQQAFRQYVGISPMMYLRDLRLELAHGDLLAGDAHTVTVAAIAQRHGFAHLGRFASYYRDRFGHNPSHTLALVPDHAEYPA
jgi:transcriptional regulator GlxA family with amidase domain